MKYKPDWAEAQQRLSALWQGKILDRPCLAVMAPNGKTGAWPAPPATDEDRWLNPEYLVQSARARLESTWWGGEAVPSVLLMAGWVVSLGGRPQFEPNTIWFQPAPVDFNQPSPFRYRLDDPWVVKHRIAHRALVALAGRDDFLIGQPCLLPANDLLSMHMGTEEFLVGLMEHPEWMRQAIVQGGLDLIQARLDLRDLTRDRHEFWYGNPGWMPFWSPEPYFATQSDVSCMLSPAQFDQYILPELEQYASAFSKLWYHLDGGNARQHLPRLLSLPQLRVIQYTPAPFEPPNGLAHLDFYRAIQRAGRIVHIQLPAENVVPLLRELDPARLMLQTNCDSIAEGEQLLAAIRFR